MSEPISVIPKNSMDEIRVMWSEYKGHRYLDIRGYTEIEGNADKVADTTAHNGKTLYAGSVNGRINACKAVGAGC